MTSASELFTSRRYRFGLRHNADDVAGFDSSVGDANSPFSHHHLTSNRRHQHHPGSQNNRREHRHDFDGCDPPSRRIHRHRVDQSNQEHEQVLPEQGGSQSTTGSIMNPDDFRSIRRRRATGNERLPGAVLLARERLVERLRGVSVSGNRPNSRSSSTAHQDDFSFTDIIIEPENNPLDFQREWLEEIAQSWQAIMPILPPPLEGTSKLSRGPAQDVLNSLPMEVFRSINGDSKECTICLEGFEDGVEVIRLNCTHRFHPGCLMPWVQVRGACPNCRKAFRRGS